MKKFKSTLECFKENELSKTHKTKIYGGIGDNGGNPGNELPIDEPFDDSGDPDNGTGPRGGGGTSSVSTASTLTNNGTTTTTTTPIKIG